MGPTPEGVRGWIAVFRDLSLLFLGVYIIVHEVRGSDLPSPLLLIVASAALGLGLADRLTK
jgi:hypothetical protein